MLNNYIGRNALELNIDDGTFKVVDGVLTKCLEHNEFCSELKIPDGVKDIGDYSIFIWFAKTLYIPKSVKIIRENWINSARRLTTIYIENSEIYMEAGCFKNLKQIKEVFIGGKKIDVLITQGEEVCLEKYLGKDKSYRIDDDVEIIGSYAFSSCDNLERVEFSKSVKNIDFWAFKDCATLKEIIVDGSIDQIGGKWMFEGCKSLQKIVLNDSVRHIDANAFKGCKLLQTVVLSKSLMYIWSSAFEDCTNIKQLVIPQSIFSIAPEAFKGWQRNQTICIPKHFKKLKILQKWRKGCKAKIKYY
ncbi:MAG: leucine-rich repeat domain-containing protein [Clostridia bacterium]|nr:leucine-rich repeat domain-containing protein [Clostridia bacterium]